MKRLVDYKEEISNDFGSTFIVDGDRLVNTIFKSEQPSLVMIIEQYIDTPVRFIKTNQLTTDDGHNSYDVYIIEENP